MNDYPMCPDHKMWAIWRNENGYYFCPMCLDALDDWIHELIDIITFLSKPAREDAYRRNKMVAERRKAEAKNWQEHLGEKNWEGMINAK